MAKLVQQSARDEIKLEHEGRSFADRPADSDLEDLTHAWGRLSDPGLQHLAIRFIRMLGEDSLREKIFPARLT